MTSLGKETHARLWVKGLGQWGEEKPGVQRSFRICASRLYTFFFFFFKISAGGHGSVAGYCARRMDLCFSDLTPSKKI